MCFRPASGWKLSTGSVRVRCAGTLCVCVTFVGPLWLRRNVWKPAVRLFFLGWGRSPYRITGNVAYASPGSFLIIGKLVAEM